MTSVGTYKVRSGDTLTAIAKRHNTTGNTLIKTNKIKAPDRINVGQVLRIADGFDAKPTRPTRPFPGLQGPGRQDARQR
jgi:LysM repeat protein